MWGPGRYVATRPDISPLPGARFRVPVPVPGDVAFCTNTGPFTRYEGDLPGRVNRDHMVTVRN